MVFWTELLMIKVKYLSWSSSYQYTIFLQLNKDFQLSSCNIMKSRNIFNVIGTIFWTNIPNLISHYHLSAEFPIFISTFFLSIFTIKLSQQILIQLVSPVCGTLLSQTYIYKNIYFYLPGYISFRLFNILTDHTLGKSWDLLRLNTHFLLTI